MQINEAQKEYLLCVVLFLCGFLLMFLAGRITNDQLSFGTGMVGVVASLGSIVMLVTIFITN